MRHDVASIFLGLEVDREEQHVAGRFAARVRSPEIPDVVPVLTESLGVGVRKTRAAIEIGWLVLDDFPDGAWLVELGPIGDEDLLELRKSSMMLPGWSVDVGNFANDQSPDPDLTPRIRMTGHGV